MNNIVMIPVEQLHHHPENPRMDLGDLTELAESIRANGIMQNLTVVPGHRMTKAEWVAAARAEGADKVSAEASYDPQAVEVSDGFTVVIGNRRMEAAKQAGLAEVPCVVSDMGHEEQIATMLQENMQRADLTVYEQAQGFQMMMDLGFSAKEIGERTGFGETTVRRRLKMAELDRDTFKKAVGKQITIEDLDRLAKIDSLKQRNALLKDYGEQNFNWNVSRAIRIQEAGKRKPAAHRMIAEAKLEKLPDNDKYSGKYRQLYALTCDLDEWDGKKNIIPKTSGKLFYTEDDTHIYFYEKEAKKKAEAKEKSEEEKAEEKRRALAWATVDRCAETSAELRAQFVKGLTVSPKNAMRMMQWALVAAFAAMMNYDSPNMTIKKRLKVESGKTIPEMVEEISRKLQDLHQNEWPGLILLLFSGDYEGQNRKPPAFADGSRNYQFPKFQRNVRMELCYEWLTEFGYQMSTEEAEMMAGTHQAFKGAEA